MIVQATHVAVKPAPRSKLTSAMTSFEPRTIDEFTDRPIGLTDSGRRTNVVSVTTTSRGDKQDFLSRFAFMEYVRISMAAAAVTATKDKSRRSSQPAAAATATAVAAVAAAAAPAIEAPRECPYFTVYIYVAVVPQRRLVYLPALHRPTADTRTCPPSVKGDCRCN